MTSGCLADRRAAQPPAATLAPPCSSQLSLTSPNTVVQKPEAGICCSSQPPPLLCNGREVPVQHQAVPMDLPDNPCVQQGPFTSRDSAFLWFNGMSITVKPNSTYSESSCKQPHLGSLSFSRHIQLNMLIPKGMDSGASFSRPPRSAHSSALHLCVLLQNGLRLAYMLQQHVEKAAVTCAYKMLHGSHSCHVAPCQHCSATCQLHKPVQHCKSVQQGEWGSQQSAQQR